MEQLLAVREEKEEMERYTYYLNSQMGHLYLESCSWQTPHGGNDMIFYS